MISTMVSTRGDDHSKGIQSSDQFAFEADFDQINKKRCRRYRHYSLRKGEKEVFGSTPPTQWLLNSISLNEDVRDGQLQELKQKGQRVNFDQPLFIGPVVVRSVPYLSSQSSCHASHRTKRHSAFHARPAQTSGKIGSTGRSCMRPLKFWGRNKTGEGEELVDTANYVESRVGHYCVSSMSKVSGYDQLSEISSKTRGANTLQKFQEPEQILEECVLQNFSRRPPDPPEISKVVMDGLHLADFETTAKQRASQLVSGWLYDVGVIDELLCNDGGGCTSIVSYPSSGRGTKASKDDAVVAHESLVVDSKGTGLAAPVTTSQSDEPSIKSSEGVEVGVHGFPIEGSFKLSQELIKLRARVQNQLDNIQYRLNDGNVAVSGLDVQEVVTAVVAATADDNRVSRNDPTSSDGGLGHLLKLSAVIASKKVMEASWSEVAPSPTLAKAFSKRFPRLLQVSSARQNLQRCMRDIDYFHQIPMTCDRLRDALWNAAANVYDGSQLPEASTPAGTTYDWRIIEVVAREHVELELFLVDIAEQLRRRVDKSLGDRMIGLTIDEEQKQGRRRRYQHGKSDSDDYASITNSIWIKANRNRSTGFFQSQRKSPKRSINSMPYSYGAIDLYLQDYRKSVRDLANDIRKRILNGLDKAWELAMSNDGSALSLLAEAVRIYEMANDDYEALCKDAHSPSDGPIRVHPTVRFEDLRFAALKCFSKTFELRVIGVFSDYIRHSAEPIPEAGETSLNDKVFDAVLCASNALISEMKFVQQKIAATFPPSWALDILYSTWVASICSKRILDQIGGTDGYKLSALTVTQLLDLVAWVESFREHVEASFPNLAEYTADMSYVDKRPELLFESENKIEVNEDVALDSLSLAYSMLWEVHDLAKDEFLLRTKQQTNEWLDHVYSAELTHDRTTTGRLVTSLCEDVFSLAGVQLRTIRGRLTRSSEALVQAVGVIFKNLYEKQIKCRNQFFVDFESCCAAANDFLRMAERCEEVLAELLSECNLSTTATLVLEELLASLVGLYSNDALFAAQIIHVYIFAPIEKAISHELFDSEWLNICTHNELALTIVRTLEDFMGDLVVYLDQFMVGKSLEALITASVNFYVKCLLRKSANRKEGSKKSIWDNDQTALMRMRGDFRVMREYFESMANTTFPSLLRIVETEFEVLDIFHELLSIACKHCDSNARDFVFLLQKRIRNVPITKLVVGDLWHLVRPTEELEINALLDEMEEQLTVLCPNDENAIESIEDRKSVPGLRLDQAVAMICDEGKRQRPLMQKARDQIEMTMKSWRKTWKMNIV